MGDEGEDGWKDETFVVFFDVTGCGYCTALIACVLPRIPHREPLSKRVGDGGQEMFDVALLI